jgi:hypothetical protein
MPTFSFEQKFHFTAKIQAFDRAAAEKIFDDLCVRVEADSRDPRWLKEEGCDVLDTYASRDESGPCEVDADEDMPSYFYGTLYARLSCGKDMPLGSNFVEAATKKEAFQALISEFWRSRALPVAKLSELDTSAHVECDKACECGGKGWELFEKSEASGPHAQLSIQRCDECAVYNSDEEAFESVVLEGEWCVTSD